MREKNEREKEIEKERKKEKKRREREREREICRHAKCHRQPNRKKRCRGTKLKRFEI